ncbi:MAG: type II secretion system F family protein, partial [Pseudomonadota bacterium]|nr:type II secretion system F family protein [Pseudomonadota bacterium]MEC9284997.1 type II secretion system F family protein [Pseudomonadota bacterium]
IVRVFDNTDAELPFVTSALIGLSSFVRAYFVWIALVIIGALFGVRWLLARPDIRQSWDRRTVRIPFIGRIVSGSNAARYASTLSILSSSGVPLVDAMTIASEVVSNEWMKRRLSDAVQRVTEGSSLRAALESTGSFPSMFLHMIASGEASGELDVMLAKVADYQQQELERIVTTLVRLFEPLMLLVMAAVVLLIVMAILLPILNMNTLVM